MVVDMTSKYIKKETPFGGARVTLLVWKRENAVVSLDRDVSQVKLH